MQKWADDTILLEGMKASNIKAFNECFEKHRTQLCTMAFSILQSEAEAKDIVQEYFIAIWEKKLYCSINTSLKNYLFTGVKNRCLNKIETNSVRKKHLVAFMLPDDYEPPVIAMEEQEQKMELQQ